MAINSVIGSGLGFGSNCEDEKNREKILSLVRQPADCYFWIPALPVRREAKSKIES
jgi:hypothetical protein